MASVDSVELELDRGQAIAELRVLAGEGVLVDLAFQPHREQAVLLGDEQRRLPLEFGPLGLGLGQMVLGLRGEHGPEPLANRVVFDSHRGKHRHHLPLNLGLGDAVTRMALGQVGTAAVVDVDLFAFGGSLHDALAGDDAAAVAAVHESARVGDFQGVVDVAAEQGLHTIPSGAIDEWLVLALVVVALVGHLAKVAAISQHRVQRGPGELGCAGPVDAAFFV